MLRRLGRLLDARRGSALILLYHRVTDVSSDPQLLCVTPDRFAEHLELIRAYFSPLSLRELTDGLATTGRLPPRAVAVTFDDGYADNLRTAKPILRKYNVPATVFVATGNVGTQREFWWDELERLLLSRGKLPPSLQMIVEGTPVQWHARSTISMTTAERADGKWHVEKPDAPPGTAEQLYVSMCRILRPLHHDTREAALEALRRWVGTDAEGRPTHRALTGKELVELAEGGDVEIGAHTVTHSMLSALPVDFQREEVFKSKTQLEQMLGSRVTSFSYPFGTPSDYSAATVGIVKEAGFTRACSNFGGGVGRRSNRFELPRVLIRNWDADTLMRRLVAAA